jgi:hypothetical protein
VDRLTVDDLQLSDKPGLREAEAIEADAIEADAIEADAIEADAIEADAIEADAIEAGVIEADTTEAEATGTETVEATNVGGTQAVTDAESDAQTEIEFQENDTEVSISELRGALRKSTP